MAGTFSVAMCTYNGARYVAEQLESIATQTRSPDEVVVCDDLSSDDTVRIVQQFAASAKFPVRLEVNSRNVGSTKNFEKAIRLCEGDLIALADQDDVWVPSKLEIIEKEFEVSPATGLVFSDAEIVDEYLRPLGVRLWASIGFTHEVRRKLRRDNALDLLLPGWTVTGATMAFRSCYRTIALNIPDDLLMIHDGWIAATIAAVAEISFIEQPLVMYRQHGGQQIGAPKKDISKSQETNINDFWRQRWRRESFDQLICVGERIRSRLLERSPTFEYRTAIRGLDARIHHMRVREHLPRQYVMRVPQVMRELFTGRYHRYSNGLYSAVKDLVG
jgi:glycosyltransferase involved in cell wall biosynthesis